MSLEARRIQRIGQLIEDIEAVREARKSLARNGQSYNIIGSHSITAAKASDLESTERKLRKELIRAMGYHTTHRYASTVRPGDTQ